VLRESWCLIDSASLLLVWGLESGLLLDLRRVEG
jgi:hypothetical protein